MEMINDFIVRLLAAMVNNIFVDLLFIAVCADMIFGTLRAAKFRCWNSAVGIDGAIRQAGMIASVLLFTIMDMLLRVDVLAWLPTEIRSVMDTIGVVKMGITELFCLLFIQRQFKLLAKFQQIGFIDHNLLLIITVIAVQLFQTCNFLFITDPARNDTVYQC